MVQKQPQRREVLGETEQENDGPTPSIHPSIYNFLPPDIWSEQSFQTDPDLPPGWKKITDMAGIYYWHIPTGTTQWERPATHPQPPGQMESTALGDHSASTPRKPSLGSLSPSPTPDHEVRDITIK